ncbi:MAG: M20/M25/M40 family metallo-hydrolase [Pseudomonadota bacterium]
MDIAALPFDADAMLARLRPWVECESPTYDPEAVDRMMDMAAHDLAALGASIDRIPRRVGADGTRVGGAVRGRLPHPRAGEPGLLILGHLDTVHPVGTLEALPFRVEDGKAWGPGICDMKGGNRIALEAIAVLAMAGIETPLPVTVLFTPDEEIGTPAFRELIEAEAARARAVLVPEPGRADGGVTSGRYAIARFEIETRGRPSHAGARLKQGRSAIKEMARRILQIEEMTSDDCTFSIGVMHAGQWANCVSSQASARVLTMAKRQADLDAGVDRMLALTDLDGDTPFEVKRGVTRPVWEPDAGGRALLDLYEGLAKSIGQPFRHESSGGGSDGNFTGAMGIPTIDGIGVDGTDMHTLNEHIDIESLATRGRIFAGLLAEIR